MTSSIDITEIPERMSLYPIQYPDLWEYYNIHLSLFWPPTDIELSKDLTQWNTKLTEDERYFIKYTLGFFAGSDFLVVKNQVKDRDEINCLEYKMYNNDKIAREDIHTRVYADLIETYVPDHKEAETLKNAAVNMPAIKAKAAWFMKYVDNGDFSTRTVASAIMEGIFFSGSFCSIFWLRKRGLMHGLADSNELISRDEGVHRDVACLVYRKYITKKKLPESVVIDMIKDAVDLEKEFCTEALPVRLIGINADLMSQYIEYVADHLTVNLLGRKIYDTPNPFDWMVIISQSVKNNFFESRSMSYAKQSLLTSKEETRITNDTEF